MGRVAKKKNVDESRKKLYRRIRKYPKEELDLLCEWAECGFRISSLEKFLCHVEEHIPQLELKSSDNARMTYVCCWAACKYESEDTRSIIGHVNYHAFHTKLKSIGNEVFRKAGLPPCKRSQDGINNVPDITKPYVCHWEDCGTIFYNVQRYYFHVEAHMRVFYRENGTEGGICRWGACKGKVAVIRVHVRSHTGEKFLACPFCGVIFYWRKELHNHCLKQLTQEERHYQCSHCFKYYPSERMLKEHMYTHVYHYACSFCGMKCKSAGALANHIRYRHLDEKPFKCESCEFRAKTRSDLIFHERRHLSENFYKCTEAGCDFSSKGPASLTLHIRQVHLKLTAFLYLCHICDVRCRRGYELTKHLVDKHGFYLPVGQKRFRYKRHEDGFYRVERVRYERLKNDSGQLKESTTAELAPRKTKQRRIADNMSDSPGLSVQESINNIIKNKIEPYNSTEKQPFYKVNVTEGEGFNEFKIVIEECPKP